MGQATLSIILDVLVIVLLVPTIGFAVILNGRLAVLRRNREELSRLVAAFNEATVRAEAGIPKLKRASDDVSRSLLEKVDRAHQLRDDLAFMVERAESASARLDLLARGAKVDMSRPDAARNEAAKVEQTRVEALRAGVMSAKTDVAYADLTALEPGRAEAVRAEIARAEISRADSSRADNPRPDMGREDPALSFAARVLADSQAAIATASSASPAPSSIPAALPSPAVMDIETAAAEAERLEKEIAAAALAKAKAEEKAMAEIARAAAAAALRQAAAEAPPEPPRAPAKASLASALIVNRQEPTLGPPGALAGALVGSVAEVFANASASGGAANTVSALSEGLPPKKPKAVKVAAPAPKPIAARAVVGQDGGVSRLSGGVGSLGRKSADNAVLEDDGRSEAERDLLRALQSVR